MHADAHNHQHDPGSELVDVVAELFGLLADPTRVRIILALTQGELSVGALADAVDRAPAAVSQHLAKLRLARLVVARQEGTRAVYRLRDEHAARLVAEAIREAEHAVTDVPGHHGAR
ncbi:ArsR/SmtB family transcription factor [Microcella flavibacter]|uniref:ArsR/SmtB family transcription factor n=1 Tax=Microcella flavibacter TaxID=1804990 RepID=UPI0014564691|nr:metalloregulator ArsR/SmtB family transcription factor [Microcella flavibacter]